MRVLTQQVALWLRQARPHPNPSPASGREAFLVVKVMTQRHFLIPLAGEGACRADAAKLNMPERPTPTSAFTQAHARTNGTGSVRSDACAFTRRTRDAPSSP